MHTGQEDGKVQFDWIGFEQTRKYVVPICTYLCTQNYWIQACQTHRDRSIHIERACSVEQVGRI